MTHLEKRISIKKMLKLSNRIDQIINEMKAREANLNDSLSKAA